MKISDLTRRDIIDALHVQGICWHGRLDEIDFLKRIFDLEQLPSYDFRFKDAAGDIWQHRVNNDDWPEDWIFDDARFGIRNGGDDIFLRFLCETIHPVVRSDREEVENLRQLYNEYLKHDGFQVVEGAYLSGRPVFTGRFVGLVATPGLSLAREALTADLGYIAQQITRMEASLPDDPALAIGTAKELIETCCKTILTERGCGIGRKDDLPLLVKNTLKELQLTPLDIPEAAKAAELIKRLLSNLGTVAQGIAELRNLYGTGHGKEGRARGLAARHAKLCVGAASTLSVFLMETHLDKRAGNSR